MISNTEFDWLVVENLRHEISQLRTSTFSSSSGYVSGVHYDLKDKIDVKRQNWNVGNINGNFDTKIEF